MTQPAIPMQAQIDHGKSTYAAEMLALPRPRHGQLRHHHAGSARFPDDKTRFITTVKNGKNNKMPPWGDILSDDEIGALWAFISSRRKP